MDSDSAFKVLLWGFLFAVLINIPYYAWVFQTGWPYVDGFPLHWLAVGLIYMATFFHEIGHTLFAWFYGYPTVPMFDFAHGGGMSMWFTDQLYILFFFYYLGLAYGIYQFREYKGIVAFFVFLFLFHVGTAYNEDARFIVIDFMGPGFEPMIASFFLLRAILDAAPRGGFERFLNALFGFGIIFKVLINDYGLLSNAVHRLIYYKQKGSHGFGDFDKIAARLPGIDFSDVVMFSMGFSVLLLILPFVIAPFLRRRADERDYDILDDL